MTGRKGFPVLRRSIAALVGGLLVASAPPASAAPPPTAPRAVAPTSVAATSVAAAQVLTWTADNDITRYRTAPAAAVAGAATLVFENSEATGNTTGMPHTLTFDTETPGYNHDVAVDVLANPFDSANGRHQVDVVLTPGKYRYHCTIPGHSTMVGELVVTAGGGGEDTTPPAVSAEVAGDRNADGDYLGEATVTVSASDAQSGVASIEYQVDDTGFETYTGPVRVTAVGDHSVQYRATDGAGNASAVGSTAFRVVERPAEDRTPPTVAAEVTGERNTSGQYLGEATVTITATDAGSGVRTTEYTLDGGPWTSYTAPVEVTAPGAHMIHHRATDNAGNTSPEGMSGFTVVAAPVEDTTPPTTTGTVTGERDADGNYLGAATVTITASDDGSGVAVVEHAVDGGAWTRHTAPVAVRARGAHTVRYRATDGAGNTAPEKSLSFTVVAPGQDACPDSDTRATVVIGDDDTGVANTDTGNGCTVSDLVDQHGDHADRGAFVRHVERVTGDLVARGLLTRREQGVLVRAASRSDIGTQTPVRTQQGERPWPDGPHPSSRP
ncbi:copper-binding protein [Saccharothrix yanglingensis]|uniref:Copper-binding protein n=1 Tax=Saccharothrix yanglingensis TaxID=659496 RepID=A0ABU0WYS7_9PSEU|nr:copper-binding protein [Saccharothrix yanglingensis]